MMLSRFCNLCHEFADHSIIHLRKFRVSTRCLQSENENKEKDPKDENDTKKKIAIITSRRKELNFYLGDTYSKFVPMPLVSRGWYHKKARGDYFIIHPTANIYAEKESEENKIPIKDLPINPDIKKNLEYHGIETTTEIQTLGIPKIMAGFNTILAAETGCGKTFAYLIPMIERMLVWKESAQRKPNTPLGLILTPSRELAIQIESEARKLTRGLDIKTKVLIGGRTKKMLRNPPMGDVDILVATLGVVSKLTTNYIYDIKSVRHLVLDEADALLDTFFHEKLIYFLRKVPFAYAQKENEDVPEGTQLTLASATMPEHLPEVLNNLVNISSLERVTTKKLHRILVPQKFIRLGPGQKPSALLKIVKPKASSKQSVIIFTKNSDCSHWISNFLRNVNVKSAKLNGQMKYHERQGQFSDFQNGKVHVLSTTDAGARGLDTLSAQYIINYDFPLQTSEYIHRCGRVGRVGSYKNGTVTNFISGGKEIGLTRKIETAIRKMRPIPMYNLHGQRGDLNEDEVENNENFPLMDDESEDEDSDDSDNESEFAQL